MHQAETRNFIKRKNVNFDSNRLVKVLAIGSKQQQQGATVEPREPSQTQITYFDVDVKGVTGGAGVEQVTQPEVLTARSLTLPN